MRRREARKTLWSFEQGCVVARVQVDGWEYERRALVPSRLPFWDLVATLHRTLDVDVLAARQNRAGETT